MYKAPPPEVSSEQFYETDPDRGFARGFSIQTVSPMPIGWAEHVLAEGHWGRGAARVHARLQPLGDDRRAQRAAPHPDNRVTLAEETDPYGLPVARMDYTLSDNDKANMAYSTKVITDILNAAGAQDVLTIRALRPPHRRRADGQRPGEERRQLRSPRWGVPNLFITDGSVCPTQGSANPALTIMALASRLAERMATGKIGSKIPARRPLKAGSVADRTIDIEATFSPRVLREYALLADGERGALIGPRGRRRLDVRRRAGTPAVFAELIRGDGVYAITPPGGTSGAGTTSRAADLAQPLGDPRRHHRVPEALAFPGDPDRAVLLRRLHGRSRGPRGVASGSPAPPSSARHGPGDWKPRRGRTLGRRRAATLGCAGAAARRARRAATGALRHDAADRCDARRHHDLVLEITDRDARRAAARPDLVWAATEEAWTQDVPPNRRTIARRATRGTPTRCCAG